MENCDTTIVIFAFCYQDDPPPPEDDENKEKRTDDISTWDADFLKVTGTLLQLLGLAYK